MINCLIYGIGGKMGQSLYLALQNNKEARCVGGVDKYATSKSFDVPVFDSLGRVNIPFDCIIDFSVKDAVYDILSYATQKNIPVVLATTGYGDKEKEFIKESAKVIPLFYSGNMSLGVNALSRLTEMATKILGEKADIEIVEAHHNQKVDAPSGTALMLLEAVQKVRDDLEPVHGREGIVGKRGKNEVGIHALRGGTIIGKHEVMFIMDSEVITIKHEAESKMVFANGSINAACFIVGKEAGLYNMDDLLGTKAK